MSRRAATGPQSQQGAPAVAELSRILSLVEQIAGEPNQAQPAALLQDEVRLGAAYAEAADVTRRRFDALAGEAAASAAAGVKMLIGRAHDAPTSAAASCLARELRRSLRAMQELLPGTADDVP